MMPGFRGSHRRIARLDAVEEVALMATGFVEARLDDVVAEFGCFKAVNDLLANYRVGDGYRLYTALTPDDTRRMSQVVDALAEPVSQVAGIVSS